jgi:tripartite-type tricarboxylate transporter receptor subunit TctC
MFPFAQYFHADLFQTIRRALFAVCLALVFPWIPPCEAQSGGYPSRPVRFVVGFPPGGGVDVVARLLGERLAQIWGQAVVVENRPGASGSIAGRQAANAKPDGYTVLVNSNSMLVHQVMNPGLGFDMERQLIAILSVAPQPIIIAVAPDLPASSVKDLIALARARKLNYGTPGLGSIPHLVIEYLFTSLSDTQMEHVPYAGAALALTATMTSQIHVTSVTMPPAVSLIKAGKIKGIAVTSGERTSALPDIPTVKESGFPGFEASAWTGFFMPAGTPKAVVDRFGEAMLKVAGMPEISDKLAGLGFVPTSTPGEQFRREISEEIKRWTGVVEKANIKIQ